MAKKKTDKTPKSKIVAAIRLLWLRSQERAAAIKRDGYACQRCGAKQSKAKGREVKVEVHHIDGIEWYDVANIIAERILQTPDRLMTLCHECHMLEHKKGKTNGKD